MKKILGIIVLILLLAHNSFAKTINIEDKILLNVPENFSYFKLETDEVADYYEEFTSSSDNFLFGVNNRINDILDEHGLYAEWVNPGVLSVQES